MKVKPRYTIIILIIGLVLGLVLGKKALPPKTVIVKEFVEVTDTQIVEVVEEKVKYKVMNAQELLNFMRIVEAEAGIGKLDTKINVAHVILNRVAAKQFPDTINEVIFQNNQFSPITDERFYSVKVSNDSAKAVRLALEGYNAHNSTYFMVERYSDEDNVKWFKDNLNFMFNDGLHDYYKAELK